LVSNSVEFEVIGDLGDAITGLLACDGVAKQVKCEGLGVGIVINDLNTLAHFIALIGSDHHFLRLLLKFRLFNNILRLERRELYRLVDLAIWLLVEFES
jgi:hypothetical protein